MLPARHQMKTPLAGLTLIFPNTLFLHHQCKSINNLLQVFKCHFRITLCVILKGQINLLGYRWPKSSEKEKEQCEKNSSPNIPRACSLFIPTNMLGQQIKAPDQQSTSAQALTLSTCLSALLEKGPKTRMSTVNWKALQNWPHCFVCPFQLLVNTHLDLTHLTRISDLVQPISALREVPATGKTRQHLRFRLLKRTSRSSISTSLLQENPHEGPNH